jgi:hypothetical protein
VGRRRAAPRQASAVVGTLSGAATGGATSSPSRKPKRSHHRRSGPGAYQFQVPRSLCVRRELHTLSSSGHLFTDLIFDLWQAVGFDIPGLDELPETIQESIRDPLIPAKVEKIPLDQRGLVWVYMQGWTQLYGVVALEVMGHMDPRVIESGEMYLDVLRNYAPRIGLGHDWDRLESLVRKRLAG